MNGNPKPIIVDALRRASGSIFWNKPVQTWHPWIGRLHGISVPRGVIPHPEVSPCGQANINILLELVDRTAKVKGDIAECGVWQGATLVPVGAYVRQNGLRKTVFGFDSFEGFDDSVAFDIQLGGGDDPNKKMGGFHQPGPRRIREKVHNFRLSEQVVLVPGYFKDSLARFADRRFSFVHLDCDLYSSYKECLEFFYPRMPKDGIIALDEYNDPPWPGCNKAVDEFLAGKPEELSEITRDNFTKYYIVKR